MTRRDKKKRRARWDMRLTDAQTEAQRSAAMAAVRALYAQVVPLWQLCQRGFCRRHKTCNGDRRACLARCWPLLPREAQLAAYHAVQSGGARRVPPATAIELDLRSFPPSNFVH